MRRSLLKRLALLGVILVIVAAIVYAFLPQPVDVDVAAVTRGALQVTVDEDGRTRIKERYVVSTPLAGRLARIVLHAGDRVEKGETLLATIEPSEPALLDERARAEAEARVKAAEAARQRARVELDRTSKALEHAKTEAARARRLVVTKAMSQEDHDIRIFRERIATEELRSAQFAVLIAEFELEQAQAVLLRTRPASPGETALLRYDIRSPITGKVLRVFQESSTAVQSGTRLLELGDPTDLEIEIDVLSADAVKIRPGAKVWLEHWGGEKPLAAQVRLVEPAAFTKISALGVEEQRVWVIADFVDPPEQRKTLGDGYRVEARIVVWEGPDVVKIPAGALFRHVDGWAVFLVHRDRARLRPVQIGPSNGLETQITTGLEPGEEVIVHPSDRIKDGVRVAPR